MLALPLVLAAYVDSDLDGVEDVNDRCPGTSLTDLVDARGCPVASTVSPHRFDVIGGIGYSRLDSNTFEETDTVLLSIQADYFYENFSFQAYTASYVNTDQNGLDDSLLAAYYTFEPLDSWQIRLGGGLLLPTYDTGWNNEAMDYFGTLDLSYRHDQITFFGGYGYTFVNDRDVPSENIFYQNTHALYGGAGYNWSDTLYGSLSYYQCDSLYRDVEALKNLSAYIFYTYDAPWFATLTYAKGLSDSSSNHEIALRLGVLF